jgi:hypothetical protein
MATISPTLSPESTGKFELHQWADFSTADTATPMQQSAKPANLATVQVVGTFGGATVTLEGSNDGTNYVTMRDVDGADISFTAAGYAEFSTAFRYIRPASTGGTGDDVDVYICLRG